MFYCREHQVSYGHAKFSKTKMEKVARRLKENPGGLTRTSSKELTSEELKEKVERKARKMKMERRRLSCPQPKELKKKSKEERKKKQLIRLINNGSCLPEKLLKLKIKSQKPGASKKLKRKYQYRNSACYKLKRTKLPCLI